MGLYTLGDDSVGDAWGIAFGGSTLGQSQRTARERE